jgi:ATP-dependent helicase/nuclease subunit A
VNEDPTPNDAQRAFAETTEGVVAVDAGAGTGKTFALTRRYARLLDRDGVTPNDCLLVTFTDTAATEMRDRIVRHCDAAPRDLADAPIGTFHAICHDLLQEHGHDAPSHLGIDHGITSATSVVADETIEVERFTDFFRRFRDDHPEYAAFYRAIDDDGAVRDLIAELAAKGVVPTSDGWFREGERHLRGDFDAFRERFDAENEPRNGGSKQSVLRERLTRYGSNATYRADAPDREAIRGHGTKQVPPSLAERAFEQDREALLDFVHDVYHGYLRFSLRRNELTFGFLQVLAYVLLCEDHACREAVGHEFVMIDEFQDTSAIQFELGLLLAGGTNFCVVGDWKQSIYSFQYADVENITRFEDRLDRYVSALNRDHHRVDVSAEAVQTVELTRNYRSTQRILDLAETGLTVPATNRETVDAAAIREQVTSLDAETDRTHSRIEAFRHAEEPAAILTRIQEIVGNDDYAVRDADGDLRPPTRGDITVLTRTRDFGRELLATAREHDVPIAYEGEVELLRSDQAKLLLAWLRILDGDREPGWAVVLERAGYTRDEIAAILDTERRDQPPPDSMLAFRESLADLESVGGVAEQVFQRYGFDGEYADRLLHTIESVHATSTMSRGDLIRYIERGIEDGATHEVATSAGEDAVLVQTIHATKGLEHPIVILANLNRYRFPPSSGGSDDAIRYADPVGLRQSTVYAEDHGVPFVYDDWRDDVLRMTLPRDYDEERRLLYVAITRARDHVLFSAGEQPSRFLEELPVEVAELEPDVAAGGPAPTEQAHLQISVPEAAGPQVETPHSIIDESVFDGETDGRGKAFGNDIHEYAEALVRGEDPDPPELEGPDCDHVAAFLDGLEGSLRAEVPIHLPLSVAGREVVLNGTADLVHVSGDAVDVVDYKTDRSRTAQAEYEIQCSIYSHVVAAAYPDRDVSARLFYTAEGEAVPVEPLDRDALADLIAERTGISSG